MIKRIIFIIIQMKLCISFSIGAPLAPSQLYKKNVESIVTILSLDKHGATQSQGSGVVVASNLIITNWHVIENAVNIVIRHGNRTWKSTDIYKNTDIDLALLTVSELNLPIVIFPGEKDRLSIGDRVFAIGNPKALELTLSDGIISAFRSESKTNYIQITTPISPGSSGGALFSEKGKFIGVTTSTMIGSQNLNFAISYEHVSFMLKNPENNNTDEFGIKKLTFVECDKFNEWLDSIDLSEIPKMPLEMRAEIYKKSIGCDYSNRDSWFFYGHLLQQTKNYPMALKVMEKSLNCMYEIDESGVVEHRSITDDIILDRIAYLAEELKLYKRAEEAYRDIIRKFDRSQADALFKMGKMYFEINNSVGVEEVYRKLKILHNQKKTSNDGLWAKSTIPQWMDNNRFDDFCKLSGLMHDDSCLCHKAFWNHITKPKPN